MSISNLRVAVRLALAFAVVCLVMSLAAAVGIWRLSGLQQIADELGGPASERAVLARDAAHSATQPQVHPVLAHLVGDEVAHILVEAAQRQAVAHPGGPLLILAGAGSPP